MGMPRFKLSTLLIALTVAAIVLAYSQARRRYLVREFADLAALGSNSVPIDDWFWPVVPDSVGVVFHESPSGKLTIRSKNYTRAEAVELYHSLAGRLRALGVAEVPMFVIMLDPATMRQSVEKVTVPEDVAAVD